MKMNRTGTEDAEEEEEEESRIWFTHQSWLGGLLGDEIN